LREIGHLRFRTNVFGAILRVRHAMTFAIHKFFNDRGFFNIHSPIITGSDCEGAGEMFRVTTLPEKDPPLLDDGKIDYSKDFFGKSTNLTVSCQLEADSLPWRSVRFIPSARPSAPKILTLRVTRGILDDRTRSCLCRP
jgi:asparaginyl-tRNA synthetase